MWPLAYEKELELLLRVIDDLYMKNHKYRVFGNNVSLSQLLRQGECDVLGISFQPDGNRFYAVDVAYHQNGLNYGSSDETVMKVIEKCSRTAFCLYGFMAVKKADIVFASPKIGDAVLKRLRPCVDELNEIFKKEGFEYRFRIIANEEFEKYVLNPTLFVYNEVSDSSELFLRSYQMYRMFSDGNTRISYTDTDSYKELRIGLIAKRILGPMLNDYAEPEEIRDMQTLEYSKKVFNLQYPLLVEISQPCENRRYYVESISISGKEYRMCSQWFEKSRRQLIGWIDEHKK